MIKYWKWYIFTAPWKIWNLFCWFDILSYTTYIAKLKGYSINSVCSRSYLQCSKRSFLTNFEYFSLLNTDFFQITLNTNLSLNQGVLLWFSNTTSIAEIVKYVSLNWNNNNPNDTAKTLVFGWFAFQPQ